jgi:hypothetical protein
MKLNKEDFDFVSLNKVFYREDQFRLDRMFSGKDDDIIIDFCLLCLKNELTGTHFIRELFNYDLESSVLFTKLCCSIRFDYEVLIDWLITNETSFLEYFLKYLKLLNSSLSRDDDYKKRIRGQLSSISHSKVEEFNKIIGLNERLDSYLDRMFDLLKKIEQKMKVLKRSFPYNCAPLIKLLEKINSFP